MMSSGLLFVLTLASRNLEDDFSGLGDEGLQAKREPWRWHFSLDNLHVGNSVRLALVAAAQSVLLQLVDVLDSDNKNL